MHFSSIVPLAFGLLTLQNGFVNALPQTATTLDPAPQVPALPDNYETLAAVEKKGLIWDRIHSTSNSSQNWNGIAESAWLLATLPPRPPFDRASDVMVPGRKKFIRNRGAHALVKLVPTEAAKQYTGIWATGAQNGLIRLTTLDEPPSNPKPDDIVIAPGGSIKFWRDGVPSTNLFFIYSLEGQTSWNYFENPCSNHLAPPKELKTKVGKKFNQRVSNYSEMTGTSDLAKFTADGKPVPQPKAPFQIWMVPAAGLKANPPPLTPETASANFASHFNAIPEGSTIYSIWAIPEPQSPYKVDTVYHPETLPNAAHIADVVSDSKFTPSYYGDAHLHFKHTSFDTDLELRPEWGEIVRSVRD
ncbi:hypothetical protein SpCBS45565_g07121 [Spizellomyces sp. 'palustris']|nr:hypothetical protein SpCBS45565_g07121 [Spizellomyces sp. 'palustris']